jgi:hypothetical protein
MNVKLGLVAAVALLSFTGLRADPPQNLLPPPPQLPQLTTAYPGNQYQANIGVTGVKVSPNVQVHAEVTTTVQPHVMPQSGKVVVIITHDVGGK